MILEIKISDGPIPLLATYIRIMPRGGSRPHSGRKKGSKNRRHRRNANGVDVASLARNYSQEALDTLADAMRDSSDFLLAIRAAAALLDRSHGKPVTAPPEDLFPPKEEAVRPEPKTHNEFRKALIERGLHETMLPPVLDPDISLRELAKAAKKRRERRQS